MVNDNKLHFAAIQIHNIDAESITERDMNISFALDKIKEMDQETDLILLPELFTSGYSENTFEKLDELAEPKDAYSYTEFSKIAREKQCYICYGFPEKDKNRFFISQNVIDDKGELVATYRKLHLAHFGNSPEKNYFTRGEARGTFSITKNDQVFNLGIIICYDMRFPELSRSLAIENDIDFLLHPVAFYKDGSFPSWHHFVITRAIENQVYMMSLNRAGKNYGNSIFCPPWMDGTTQPVITGHNEQVLIHQVDKEMIQKSRETYPLRRDRKSSY